MSNYKLYNHYSIFKCSLIWREIIKRKWINYKYTIDKTMLNTFKIILNNMNY